MMLLRHHLLGSLEPGALNDHDWCSSRARQQDNCCLSNFKCLWRDSQLPFNGLGTFLPTYYNSVQDGGLRDKQLLGSAYIT